MPITEPGIYTLDDDTYHGDPTPEPSLSSGIVRTLIYSTPLHAWQRHPKLGGGEPKSNQRRLDLGSLVHTLVLGDGREVAVIDADDWRATRARTEELQARSEGKIPVLVKDYDKALSLAERVKPQLPVGETEMAFIWKEPTTHGEVYCRSKPDRMLRSRHTIFDLKTVSQGAGPRDFRKSMYNNGYNHQAAFYSLGYERLIGARPRFIFVAVELDPPHAVGWYEVGGRSYDRAFAEVGKAIDQWGRCLSTDSWPGYPQTIVELEDFRA